MSTNKTPGVYVQEISTLPPSIASVETAIPAFIGYTERADFRGEDLSERPIPIISLLEYEERFGGPPEANVNKVSLDMNNNVEEVKLGTSFLLYDSLRMFFANGGGKCYIISVGKYSESGVANTVDKVDLEKGIGILAGKDEPTLILFPDAVQLKSTDLYGLQATALKQCNELKDRFVIMDLLKEKEGDTNFDWKKSCEEFRNQIGMQFLNYGAAYTPYLKTNLDKKITFRHLKGKLYKLGAVIDLTSLTDDGGIQSAIKRVQNAILDVDEYQSVFTSFLGNNTIDTLSEGYLKRLNDFKANAALFDPNAGDAATLADTIRANYKELFVFIYKIIYYLVETPAINANGDFSLSVNGDKYLTSAIRSLISSSLRGHMLQLNKYCKNGVKKYVGENSQTPSDKLDKLFEEPFVLPATPPSPARFTVSEWTIDNKSAFIDADIPNELNDLYTMGVYGTDISKMIKNMVKAEPAITGIFKRVEEAIQFISSTAGEFEKRYDQALLETFPLFRAIVNKVKNASSELPPSGVMAGIYAQIDNARGVWKAPANVSPIGVVGLSADISHQEQEDLNVDPIAGKSINVIRAFPGKGILVWGARTLAGNDNEWRYVSVRRFFIFAEESIKKAIERFVFEPNVQDTWIKVKGAIEHFLTDQWKAGALAGATPQQAFFVSVGLGQTMTAQDILEGRMIVEVGMAASRPAEFIILKFWHKLQEA